MAGPVSPLLVMGRAEFFRERELGVEWVPRSLGQLRRGDEKFGMSGPASSQCYRFPNPSTLTSTLFKLPSDFFAGLLADEPAFAKRGALWMLCMSTRAYPSELSHLGCYGFVLLFSGRLPMTHERC